MKKQVFISHQKKDRDEAQEIANYLEGLGVSVYFDEYDRALQVATFLKNSKKVVEAIKEGINNSSHMLCIISPNTLLSKWVPFEVGYGYGKTNLATLTLKGIEDSDLPDYIKVAPVIRNANDIDSFIKKNFEYYKPIYESTEYFSDYSLPHPLSDIMDV